MRVDVIDFLRFDLRVAQGVAHRARQPLSVWFGRNNVVSIGALSPADRFGINLRAAFARMFQLLQKQNSRTAAGRKPVAIFVECTRAARWIGRACQGAHARERQDAKQIAILGADHKHGILSILPDEIGGITEGVRGRRTRAD